MSIASLIPVRIGLFDRTPRQPKHSAPAEAERLRRKLGWADSLIKTQQVQIDDTERKLANATERADIAVNALAQAENGIRLRDQRITELERRLQVGVLAEAAAAKTQEIPIITAVMPLHKAPLATPDTAA